MCLTLDMSLDCFSPDLVSDEGDLYERSFFSSRINFMILNTVCMLKNSQICIWARPLLELQLVYLTAHLTSLTHMSRTELLFPPVCSTHSLYISVAADSILPASWFKNPGIILDSSVFYPVSSALANSVGSIFKIDPEKSHLSPSALLLSSSKPPTSLA